MEIDFMEYIEEEKEKEPEIMEKPKKQTETFLEKKEAGVFDLEIAKSKLNAESVKDLVKQAEAFTVSNDEEAEQGVALAMQSRKIHNAIENARKAIVRPHLDFQKAVKTYSDSFSTELKKMERTVLTKVESFQTKKRMEEVRLHAIKMKKEKEERDRIEAENKKIEAERKRIEEENKKLEKPIPVPAPVPVKPPEPAPFIPAPQKISVADGVSTTELVWSYKIEDEAIIPRNWLVIDERAIKQSIKAGIRAIPGVKIYSEEVKRYRVK